jgi:hypothetical protein
MSICEGRGYCTPGGSRIPPSMMSSCQIESVPDVRLSESESSDPAVVLPSVLWHQGPVGTTPLGSELIERRISASRAR